LPGPTFRSHSVRGFLRPTETWTVSLETVAALGGWKVCQIDVSEHVTVSTD